MAYRLKCVQYLEFDTVSTLWYARIYMFKNLNTVISSVSTCMYGGRRIVLFSL